MDSLVFWSGLSEFLKQDTAPVRIYKARNRTGDWQRVTVKELGRDRVRVTLHYPRREVTAFEVDIGASAIIVPPGFDGASTHCHIVFYRVRTALDLIERARLRERAP